MGKRNIAALFLPLLLCLLPGTAAEAAESIPPVPEFSLTAGFYAEEQLLELSAPKGYEILYTLDCTDPAASATAQVYTGPILLRDNSADANVCAAEEDVSLMPYTAPETPVEKAMVVHAVCRDRSGRCGKEATNTYFIGPRPEYYSTLAVVSLVVNFEDLFDPGTGIYTVGSGYYAWLDSPDFTEYHPMDDHNPTNYNASGAAWERKASFQFLEEGQAVYSQTVGLRIHGAWSRYAAQKSFRLIAREDYGSSKLNYPFFGTGCTDAEGKTLASFDKLVLRNGGNDNSLSHLRDDLNAVFLEELGLDCADRRGCIVFLNGEFWGFYSLQERLEDEYIQSHYGIPKENITVSKNGEFTSGSEAVYAEYVAFYHRLQTMDLSEPEAYAEACRVMDPQELIRLFVAQSYVCNRDFAIHINNWLLWRANEPVEGKAAGDGRWHFLVFDTDCSLAIVYDDDTSFTTNYLRLMDLSTEELGLPALFMKFMENEGFRREFLACYRQAQDTVFLPKHALGILEELSSVYRAPVMDTLSRFRGGDVYDDDLARIRRFLLYRSSYALVQAELFCRALS